MSFFFSFFSFSKYHLVYARGAAALHHAPLPPGELERIQPFWPPERLRYSFFTYQPPSCNLGCLEKIPSAHLSTYGLVHPCLQESFPTLTASFPIADAPHRYLSGRNGMKSSRMVSEVAEGLSKVAKLDTSKSTITFLAMSNDAQDVVRRRSK